MGYAGAAAAEDEAVAQTFRLEIFDELGKVLDMDVLLGDGLGNEKHVGVDLERLFDKLLVRDLGAQVVSLYHLVALQPVMPGEALAVHYRVDADGMRVRAGGGADEYELSAEMLLDVLVGLLHAHRLLLDGDHVDVLVIHGVRDGAVNDEERELLIKRFGAGDVRLVDAHFADELAGGLHAAFIVLDGQGEGELHLAVVHRVAVSLYAGGIEFGIEIRFMRVVKSARHGLHLPFHKLDEGVEIDGILLRDAV